MPITMHLFWLALVPILVYLNVLHTDCEDVKKYSPESFSFLEDRCALELKFVEKLRSALYRLNSTGQSLAEAYLKEFDDDTEGLRGFDNLDVKAKCYAVASNPIAIYHMTTRDIHELDTLTKYFVDNEDPLNQEFPADMRFSYDDFVDACLNIVQICFLYNLDVTEVAEGNFLGMETGAKLKAKHCAEIQHYAREYGNKQAIAVEFAEVTLEKAEIDGTVSKGRAEMLLEITMKHHDEIFKRMPNACFNRKLIPLQEKFGDKYKEIRRRSFPMLWEMKCERPDDPFGLKAVDTNKMSPPEEGLKQFYSVCHPENKQLASVEADLRCWFSSKPHPYWTIHPLKVEQLYKDPELLHIYDVLSPKLVQEITNAAEEVAEIPGMMESGSWFYRFRILQMETGCINDTAYPNIMISFVKTVETLLGLDIRGAREFYHLQTNIYAPGGHFFTHEDASYLSPNNHSCNRLVSVFVYLNEPKLGGYTGFPMLNVAAKPTAGSVLVWHNIHGNMFVMDPMVQHRACPLILGKKIAGVFYIDGASQIFSRPCPLRPMQRFCSYF